jgi:biopolymer transport protein ExbD|tara:strand:+ start:14050 stop:14460 length:411 start_codon:yes stop_codon:yes gene_type:complete
MDLGSRNKIKVEGGMASMTDLVFLLLIFFIIMSLMSNNQTPLDLPKSDESLKPDQNPVTATVMITQDNKYVVLPGGSLDQPMEFDEIKELAAQAVMNSGEFKLKVAGHREASYEAVFKVLALAQANEWDPVIAYNK